MKTLLLVSFLLAWLSAPILAADPPPDLTLDLGNGISLKAVLIPAGTFMMGSVPNTSKDNALHPQPNEMPQHQVTISKPFYMGIYPVTQEQFDAILGPKAGQQRMVGPQNPAQPFSFDQITDFCAKVSAKTGQTVRLPTEAEWEYAARAGTTTAWFFGDDSTLVNDYGWFFYPDKKPFSLHPVGQKKPNPWGLYDMYGDVAQVVSDLGGIYPHGVLADYPAGPVTDPTGPAGTPTEKSIYPPKVEPGQPAPPPIDPPLLQHVLRGGSSWIGNSRSASRGAWANPEGGDHYFGFRVVVEAPK
jgi:formylglycine-generating enzyme required for sulfatase activity